MNATAPKRDTSEPTTKPATVVKNIPVNEDLHGRLKKLAHDQGKVLRRMVEDKLEEFFPKDAPQLRVV